MEKGDLKISINASWAKKVKKSEFVKNLEKAYPETDLDALYEEINPKKSTPAKEG